MDWLMPLSLERGLPGAAQKVGFAHPPPTPTPRLGRSGSYPGHRALCFGSEGSILALSTVVPLRQLH